MRIRIPTEPDEGEKQKSAADPGVEPRALDQQVLEEENSREQDYRERCDANRDGGSSPHLLPQGLGFSNMRDGLAGQRFRAGGFRGAGWSLLLGFEVALRQGVSDLEGEKGFLPRSRRTLNEEL